MCSGSEAGSYVRLIDFVYHSTLGLRVIKKKKEEEDGPKAWLRHDKIVSFDTSRAPVSHQVFFFFFFFSLVTGPSRSLSLKLRARI